MGLAKKQEQEMIIELFFARKSVFIFFGFPKTLDCNLWAVDAFEEDPTLLFLSIEASILKIS
jgi:hypothetical protein